MSWVCPQCHVLIDDDTFSQCWSCCAQRHPSAETAVNAPQCCGKAMLSFNDPCIDPLSLAHGKIHTIEPFKLFACAQCGRVERYLTSSALEHLLASQKS